MHEYQEKLVAVQTLDKQLGVGKPIEQQFEAEFKSRLTRMYSSMMSLDNTIPYTLTAEDLAIITQTAESFNAMLLARHRVAKDEAIEALLAP